MPVPGPKPMGIGHFSSALALMASLCLEMAEEMKELPYEVFPDGDLKNGPQVRLRYSLQKFQVVSAGGTNTSARSPDTASI